MAGHSKWANIKRRKGAQDDKRGKVFTRMIKEICIAIKQGNNADPAFNPSLRVAIANAKGVNMPKDTIERAIKKASAPDADQYHQINFEGYAPYGIGIYIECTTDNNRRTVANIRSIFNKYGGNLGINGELSFIFDRKGIFTLDKDNLWLETKELELIEQGAEEIEVQHNTIIITTNFEHFGAMQIKLEELEVEPIQAELQRIPNSSKELPLDKAKRVLAMVEKFEQDNDVQYVFHNLELTEELIKAIG